MTHYEIEVENVTPSCTYLRGVGVREMVTEIKGRPPVWATRARAWVVQPHTAAEVVALAESRHRTVLVKGRQVSLNRATAANAAVEPVDGTEAPETQDVLW